MTTSSVHATTKISLRARIAHEASELPPAQAKLASFLLGNIDVASDYTITELAEATGVSPGTVSQLSRRFGFRGYQELRLALAREAVLSSVRASGADAGEHATEDSGPDEVTVNGLLEANVLALVETKRTLSITAVRAAVDTLVNAAQVECVGAGTAALVAAEAAIKLRKLGVVAYAPTDSHAQVMAAANLHSGDALIAVSHSGRTIDTIRCAELARDSGATVIAVTGPGQSPLAGSADIVIETVSYDQGFQVEPMASAVTGLSVIQVLFVLLLDRKGQAAEDALSRTQQATEDKHVRGRFTHARR